MRWVTQWSDMRWVTCDEWPEIETCDERHDMSDVMMTHEMSDMRWVTCDEWHLIKWLWPYTLCEFHLLNPLVNPLRNPFLIPWGQAEWSNDETWDEWHEIETEMSEKHPETLILSSWAEGRCRVGISYCGGGEQRWAEVGRGHEQTLNVANLEYIGSNLISLTWWWDVRWVK